MGKGEGGGCIFVEKMWGQKCFFFDIPLPLFEFAFIGRVSEILLGQKMGFLIRVEARGFCLSVMPFCFCYKRFFGV